MCSRAHSPGSPCSPVWRVFPMILSRCGRGGRSPGAGACVPVPRCSPVHSCGRVQGVGSAPVPRSLPGVVRVLPALSRRAPVAWRSPGSPFSCVRVAPGVLPGVVACSRRVSHSLPAPWWRWIAPVCVHSLPARVLPFILPRWLTGGRSPGSPLSPWCVLSRFPRRGWIT